MKFTKFEWVGTIMLAMLAILFICSLINFSINYTKCVFFQNEESCKILQEQAENAW
jgi:hypothetical protein